MDLEALKKEALALGLNWRAMFNGKPVIDGDSRLLEYLYTCHGKTDKHPEIQELRQYLGHTDARWIAYAELRNQVVKQRRAQKYRVQTDGILIGAIADSIVSFDGEGYLLRIPKGPFDEWREARRRVKETEPYEVGQ
jgi:hypothetical protein